VAGEWEPPLRRARQEKRAEGEASRGFNKGIRWAVSNFRGRCARAGSGGPVRGESCDGSSMRKKRFASSKVRGTEASEGTILDTFSPGPIGDRRAISLIPGR